MTPARETSLPNPSPTSKTARRSKAARASPREARSAAEIFGVLRIRIAQQQIAPGAKLRETDLAEEFGVSRARIRDALGALEQRGLVERIPNRGAVVTRLDLSQVFHIYDIREVLEGLAARLATQNVPNATWKEDFARFQGPLKELIERGELTEYVEHYERLRRKIIEAAGNPLLAEMLDIIFEKTQVLIRRIIILPGRPEIGRRQHAAMLQAMCRGAAEEAETIRRNGLRSARLSLEKYQHFIL
ncbi:MAG: GntR family transcriptional regulator [Burkholderiales bacterium]|nr:GntR family transcriptional regulator [Burkholderiales bacterium]